jgi:hypothetical protein
MHLAHLTIVSFVSLHGITLAQNDLPSCGVSAYDLYCCLSNCLIPSVRSMWIVSQRQVLKAVIRLMSDGATDVRLVGFTKVEEIMKTLVASFFFLFRLAQWPLAKSESASLLFFMSCCLNS